MKIIFFGSGPYVSPIIESLKKNFNLVLVVTTEKETSEPVVSHCLANEIPYLSVKKFNPEIINEIKDKNVPLAVLAYFGLILPAEILNLFPKGIINTHPSLLPKYRGPTPGQTAILNGDAETGVTIIKLDKEVDHGPILDQVKEPILENDTAESLYKRLFEKGAEMLGSIIRTIELGKEIKEEKQDDSKASFTKRMTKQDGYIDIDNPPSPKILNRMIRAYYPWPNAWTVLSIKNKVLRIKLLPEKKLQAEGGKPMSIKDFLNGYPESKTSLMKILSI